MTHPLHVKRIYDPPSPQDGARLLVDRLWPRGISKEKADLTAWLKNVAPSTALRQWFGHDPAKWEEFSEHYRKELNAQPQAVEEIRAYLRKGTTTLLFGARDTTHNEAVVLADYLREN
ncbi:DUF488 domain-containing protein [Kozakia baliensis]|uniref:DUF488 domain-containing protein n=1 Tax=Kozakia baliensis TaxID=153496 RepID=UPI000498613C|nr:DUF488 domain-containing protein [Kozakia baliensis]